MRPTGRHARSWRCEATAGALLALALVTVLVAGCGDDGVGDASGGSGPRVVFDPLARPVPEIPFPNDVATVMDTHSPTGRRVNIRWVAPTRLESGIRDRINDLDGFGTYAPVTVPFDGRLDTENLVRRHRPDYDFSDDAVYLINLDPTSPRYGDPVPLDMGTGNFPKGLPAARNWRFDDGDDEDPDVPSHERRSRLYFKNDYREAASNLLFETEEEDRNCNGVLDPGEDTDFDGVLDHPNVPDPERFNDACWPSGEAPRTLTQRAKYDELVTFYEFETDTLILRPIVPLEQGALYGVVLTDRLTGVDGEPVRSPFDRPYHATQGAEVARLEGVLADRSASWGVGPGDVAFAWTFTTQTVTRELETIRDGIDGRGTLAWLRDAFPPRLGELTRTGVPALGNGNPYIVKVENFLLPLFVLAILNLGDIEMVLPLVESYANVDYMVTGSFEGPYFLDNEAEVFRMDAARGTAQVTSDEVTFWLVVPKRRRDLPGPAPPGYPADDEPFGVTFYGHGYSMSRTEALGFAGLMARFGIATLGMDAPGHGPLDQLADIEGALRGMALDAFGTETLDEGVRELLTGVLGERAGGALYEDARDLLAEILLIPLHPEIDDPAELPEHGIDTLDALAVATLETPFLKGGFLEGRARDHTGDGLPDSGADFWTARTFHTRDIVRQGVVDHLQMVRILETFDGTTRWGFDVNGNGQRDDLAGDFDGDGVPDVGGTRGMGDAWGRTYTWGQSLGGFFSSIHAAVDPSIVASVPVSAGAGLTDIGLRSTQDGVFQAVFLELFGPMIVGGPGRSILFDDYRNTPEEMAEHYREREPRMTAGDLDRHWLAFDKLLGNKEEIIPIAPVPDLEPGDTVEVINLANGEVGHAGVRRFEDGHPGFRAAVESDFGDRLAVTIRDAAGEIKARVEASAPTARGYAHARCSPDLRRFLGLAQMILTRGDPAAYAPHLVFDPLPGMRPGNILFVHSVGDPVVPIATGVAKARCAGLLGWQDPGPGLAGAESANDYLIRKHVTEGLKHLARFTDGEGEPILFDPDNLSRGRDGLPSRKPEPGRELRVRHVRVDGAEPVGMSGVRFPFTDYANTDLHGVDPPLSRLDFDVGTFTTHQIATFFYFDGACITDDPCLADRDLASCDWFREGRKPEDCR